MLYKFSSSSPILLYRKKKLDTFETIKRFYVWIIIIIIKEEGKNGKEQ